MLLAPILNAAGDVGREEGISTELEWDFSLIMVRGLFLCMIFNNTFNNFSAYLTMFFLSNKIII